MNDKIIKLDLIKGTHTNINEFTKDGIIAPDGTFYAFGSSEHLRAWDYIAIMFEGVTEKDLNAGGFFKDFYGCVLKRQSKYIEVKDMSWLTKIKNDISLFGGEPTQRQLDTIFDYDQHFDTNLFDAVKYTTPF